MKMLVEAILFDIDGTLIDSTSAVERCWKSWGATYNVDPEDIFRVCHGRRTQDTVAEFLPAHLHAEAVNELEQLELNDLHGIHALPGAAAALRLPSNRWAVVTSGSSPLMRARLAAAGLPVPVVFITADDVSEGKPSPEGYLLAASALNVDIRRCLVVEDAPAGLAAGKAAGARTLAVTTSHARPSLRSADIVIDTMESLAVENFRGGLVEITFH